MWKKSVLTLTNSVDIGYTYIISKIYSKPLKNNFFDIQEKLCKYKKHIHLIKNNVYYNIDNYLTETKFLCELL